MCVYALCILRKVLSEGQKQSLNLLELGLSIVMSYPILSAGTKFGTFAARTLNCEPPLSSQYSFYFSQFSNMGEMLE